MSSDSTHGTNRRLFLSAARREDRANEAIELQIVEDLFSCILQNPSSSSAMNPVVVLDRDVSSVHRFAGYWRRGVKTLLHEAAEEGNAAKVQRELANGISVDLIDNNGHTPLWYAACNGHFHAVQVLVQHGADVDLFDRLGNSPLKLAAMGGHHEIVQYLVKHGGDVNHVNEMGYTALMSAAGRGYTEIVKYLLDNGADINHFNEDQFTALHLAASDGYKEIVQCLVQYGADVNFENLSSRTALQLAAFNEHDEIVKYLTQHGASLQRRVFKNRLDMYSNWGYPIKEPTTIYTKLGEQQLTTNHQSSATKEWFIDPSHVELVDTEPVHRSSIYASERYGKWMGAPVAVKEMVSNGSNMYHFFYQEVHTWYQLNHPHVVKLYGAWDTDSLCFVCDHPTNGSLDTYLQQQHGHKSQTWKKLFEAALGLQYLHERGIVHGNLRCSNILVGGDGTAKLADFGLSFANKNAYAMRSSYVSSSVRWSAPECLRDEMRTFASDVYSFGLCVIEAVSGKVPWIEIQSTFHLQLNDGIRLPSRPSSFNDDQWMLVERMCARDVSERLTMLDVVRELHHFAKQEEIDIADTGDLNSVNLSSFPNVTDVRIQELNGIPIALALRKMKTFASTDPMNLGIHGRLEDIYGQMKLLKESPMPLLVANYVKILIHFDNGMKENATKPTMHDFVASRQRINNNFSVHGELDRLMEKLDLVTTTSIHQWKNKWKTDREQLLHRVATKLNAPEDFVDELGEDLTTQTEVLACLRFELSKHRSSYQVIAPTIIEQAITHFASITEAVIPDWFIPSYEVAFDKAFNAGSFGSVHHGTWLSSNVIVKKVFTKDPGHREMFEREVDIWFKLVHPHVVRLFGACHVGEQPFFVCEHAGNGQLDLYLKEHKDETWTKLYEAALGLQYLHYRGIVHGDLKCNNILIGSDGLAKLMDFGLSLDSKSERKHDTNSPVGAVRWKAPECLEGEKPTFASDVYSFGMCIVEAVSGEFPWGNALADAAVKFHVKKGKLPERPVGFVDDRWRFVVQMCTFHPQDRPTIQELAQQLKIYADFN